MRTLLPLLACLALSCAAEVGEECSQTGETDECVEGAICDTEGSGAICMSICDTDADCPSTHACTGVSGSNVKACHAR